MQKVLAGKLLVTAVLVSGTLGYTVEAAEKLARCEYSHQNGSIFSVKPRVTRDECYNGVVPPHHHNAIIYSEDPVLSILTSEKIYQTSNDHHHDADESGQSAHGHTHPVKGENKGKKFKPQKPPTILSMHNIDWRGD